MANEPITREEILLNAVATGEAANLEPITREEMFLAKLGGADVKIPTPITRKEQFLQKAIESGGTPGGGGGSTDEGWIGDGNTHIWISLAEGRTSPMLGVCPNGTVTVDWGDGTAPDTLTGTSTSTVKWTPTHNYAKPGDYVITLTVDGEMGFTGSSSTNQYACILRHSNLADGRNRIYQSMVKKVEIGNGVTTVGNYSFTYCNSLANVFISEDVISIGDNAFNNCYALTNVFIPNGVTSIGQQAFGGCYSLVTIFIPNGVTAISRNTFTICYSLTTVFISEDVTSIDNFAFYNCFGVRYYDFTKHTSVPALANTSAFASISSDCEIRVPAALYDEWIAATNWTTYASYIKAM